MSFLPNLQESTQSRMLTDTFLGFDHNLKAADGTWFEEVGLSSRAYPLFAPRVCRGTVDLAKAYNGAHQNNLKGIITKEKLCWINGTTIYVDGLSVPGVQVTSDDVQLVSMGAYLCVFPDGIYVNTQDLSDSGYMSHTNTLSDDSVTITPCTMDGVEYELDNVPVQANEPEDPKNGDYWIDSSNSKHALKKYSTASAMWVTISTVYLRMSADGIGDGFGEQDAVRISGLHLWAGNPIMQKQVEDLNTDVIITKADKDNIIFPGIIDHAVTVPITEYGELKVSRRVPVMDHVCELDNRLWGCRYGKDDTGEMVNMIYASALGDCKNWYRYAGISTDSYSVNCGSDGPFTGMIAYQGYVLAWKENCVHKVYGTLPSNFQVTTTQCRGVAVGSGRSLAIVNELLLYLSRNGVLAYDGSMPASVSDAFAGETYSCGVSGVCGSTYYISMHDRKHVWQMWTYDTDHQLWHHESDTQVVMFTRFGNDLLYLDKSTGRVISVTGENGDKEHEVEFDAISGIIGYEYPDQKYISRLNLRVKMHHGDYLEILVRYDSEGDWEPQGAIDQQRTGSFVIPVIPRRCDHMQIRLRGHGDIRIFSIAKILEVGSDA